MILKKLLLLFVLLLLVTPLAATHAKAGTMQVVCAGEFAESHDHYKVLFRAEMDGSTMLEYYIRLNPTEYDEAYSREGSKIVFDETYRPRKYVDYYRYNLGYLLFEGAEDLLRDVSVSLLLPKDLHSNRRIRFTGYYIEKDERSRRIRAMNCAKL